MSFLNKIFPIWDNFCILSLLITIMNTVIFCFGFNNADIYLYIFYLRYCGIVKKLLECCRAACNTNKFSFNYKIILYFTYIFHYNMICVDIHNNK